MAPQGYLSLSDIGQVFKKKKTPYTGKLRAFLETIPLIRTYFVVGAEGLRCLAPGSASNAGGPINTVTGGAPLWRATIPGGGPSGAVPSAVPVYPLAPSYAAAAALPTAADLSLSFVDYKPRYARVLLDEGGSAPVDYMALDATAVTGLGGELEFGEDADLATFLAACPPGLAAAIRAECALRGPQDLCEIVVDDGRPEAELRFDCGDRVFLHTGDALGAHVSVGAVLAHLSAHMPGQSERLSKDNR